MLIGVVEGTSLSQVRGLESQGIHVREMHFVYFKLCLSQSIFFISHQSSRAAIFIIAIKFLLVYHDNSET